MCASPVGVLQLQYQYSFPTEMTTEGLHFGAFHLLLIDFCSKQLTPIHAKVFSIQILLYTVQSNCAKGLHFMALRLLLYELYSIILHSI